jgi:Putative beta-lactamase-inhibitor-like, PepSY-like
MLGYVGRQFELDMVTTKSYHMKSLCVLGLYLFISIASISQDNNSKPKGKSDKVSHSNQQNGEKIKLHEKVIWAGTGIDLNDKAKDAKNVPDAVMSAFRQLFPNQPIDNVRKYRGLYAITFSNEVFTTTFIYQADGTFVETRTVATDSVIPATVKQKVKETKVDYQTNEVVLIEKANKQKFYRYHLRKNNSSEYLVYNEAAEEVKYDY